MCSLSKNFISIGAKLEVCQDLSSSECNLHISPNGKRVFYATVILLVGLLVLYIFKSKFLKIPFIFSLFFLSEFLETGVCRVYFSKALKRMCLRILLNLYMFSQNSLHLSAK